MHIGFADLVVYLVEPSPTQARIVTEMLDRLGVMRVQRFELGNAALAQMCEALPSVVISALYLPDLTGTELVAAMRGDPELQQVPFVLVSSETRPQVLDPVRQSGVCGILPKPFDELQLRTALRTTLEYLSPDDELGSEGFHVENLRVLIVDDSPSARRFVRRVFENLGVTRFAEAGDGAQAAQLLADTMVDLVVTDYNMPAMDGAALVRHIRTESWQSSVPILMVTSERDQGRLAAIEEAGVSGIFDKPFEPQFIKALLRKVMQHD